VKYFSKKTHYFAGTGVSAGAGAGFAEQQAFFASLVHSFDFGHSVLSFLTALSLVPAVTVEAAKPIVNATAKIIANFFMIKILIGY
jgi:hypothetical protein